MDLLNNLKHLNIDGNKIAVCKTELQTLEKIKRDFALRKIITSNYRKKIDTLMFYANIENKVSCLAFEPNHGNTGEITTVCGNGLKAIASVIPQDLSGLVTGAGTFTIKKNGRDVVINFGKFLSTKKIEKDFLNIGLKEIKKSILPFCVHYGVKTPVVTIGYNAQNKDFVGEPHLVIGTFSLLQQKKLRSFARDSGLLLRRLNTFKIECNITFFSFSEMKGNICRLNACTFERHLGGNPKIAITGSCGTGSMAASNVFLNQFLARRPQKTFFEINFPKGILNVEINKGRTFLKGKKRYEII